MRNEIELGGPVMSTTACIITLYNTGLTTTGLTTGAAAATGVQAVKNACSTHQAYRQAGCSDVTKAHLASTVMYTAAAGCCLAGNPAAGLMFFFGGIGTDSVANDAQTIHGLTDPVVDTTQTVHEPSIRNMNTCYTAQTIHGRPRMRGMNS